ncbi:hypothetical protein BDV06DRAFT_228681 [Aspergillus oleicola]
MVFGIGKGKDVNTALSISDNHGSKGGGPQADSPATRVGGLNLNEYTQGGLGRHLGVFSTILLIVGRLHLRKNHNMKLSTLTVCALLGLTAAAPSQNRAKKMSESYDVGECNGTSCYANLVNTECTKGSCVGEGGDDGAKCHVAVGNKGQAWCPVGCDGYYCP